MIFKFFPKDFNFFDLFDAQVNCAVDAARYFNEAVSSGNIGEGVLSKMHQLEHDADDVAHKLIKQLNQTFITPFDREDIFSLVRELDDITDMLYTIISRLKVYKIKGVNKHLVEFAAVIQESVDGVSCAVKAMRNMKNADTVSKACVEVNRLENVGDAMRDAILGELFENEKDPMMVMKLKEIYEYAETVLDICEDVVHVVESILVKQA